MQAGVKVVRGRDWKWNNQDETEGMVGTVIKLGEQKCQLVQNETVFVCWDNGHIANYRVGRDNAYDLCLFESSLVGSVHQSKSCSECKRSPLVGIRWQCFSCDNVHLCTSCYGKDCHSVAHEFLRFDWPGSAGCKVPPRQNAEKLEAKGLFSGAVVTRGPHWRWKDQDGGEGNQGILMKIVDTGNGAKNWAEVLWNNNGSKNQYSIGGMGRVDIVSVQHGSGGHYYPTHLALLGTPESQRNDAVPSETELKPGTRVQVNLDPDVFEAMQQGHGGWNHVMIGCIGCVGRIEKIDGDGDAVVRYPKFQRPFAVNPAALTVVTRGFRKGDKVRIADNELLAETYQQHHGGWNDDMRYILGQTGTVVSSDNDFNVVVLVGARTWHLSPGLCTLVTPGEGTDTQESSPTVIESDASSDSESDSDSDVENVGLRVPVERRDLPHMMRPLAQLFQSQQLMEASQSGNAARFQELLGQMAVTAS